MRDPLAEPTATPAQRGTCRICDKTIALLRTGIVRAHRARGRIGPWCLGAGEFPADTPLTLRDLIRAARSAGLVLKRNIRDRGRTQWRARGVDERARLLVEHDAAGWTVWIVGPGGAARVDHATVDRIADAARLCGWELGAS